MSDIAKLSAAKLHALIAVRERADNVALDAVIAAGMGNMTGNQIREFAKGSSMLNKVMLARKRIETRDALQEAYDELDARKRYHGGDKPIKRSA